MTIRAVSYGGGVQSTALLVLAAQGRIDFPLFLMANVGDDSEHPATLEYVRHIAMPYAEHHGIELALLDRKKRDGSTETLYGRLTKPDSRSLPIPVRMDNGAPGNRSCTADFKIRVTGKELKRRGATENDKAVIGIGISLDEIHRANSRKVEPHEKVVYPLIGIGEETGLKLNRIECQRLVAAEPLPEPLAAQVKEAVADGRLTHASTVRQLEVTGYTQMPVPPKSSCFFCPFHRPTTWADMRRNEPELFEKAARLEDTLNERRDKLGKDHVYFTRFAMPLRQAIADKDDVLFDLDDAGSCDSGWCMT